VKSSSSSKTNGAIEDEDEDENEPELAKLAVYLHYNVPMARCFILDGKNV